MSDLPVVDTHIHPMLKKVLWGKSFEKNYSVASGNDPFTMRATLSRLIEGNVKGAFSTLYVLEPQLVEKVWIPKAISYGLMKKVGNLKKFHRMFTDPPDNQCFAQLYAHRTMIKSAQALPGPGIEIANTYTDYRRIRDENKIAFVTSIEGAHTLNGNLENVEKFAAQGVAHMIIPHLFPNEAGPCSNGFPDELGLWALGLLRDKYTWNEGFTSWGRDLVENMFDIGMIVDVTHGTPMLRDEAYHMARRNSKKRPVIMSHTGLYEFAPYAMNATAEDVKNIANTGGTVGLIFMNHWLHKPKLRDGVDIIKKSIDYVINQGGEGCIAFGSDFDGMTAVPRDLKSPSDYIPLRLALQDFYKPRVLEKIFYKNAERVLELGWGN